MTRARVVGFLAAWALALMPLAATAAGETEGDRTLSPYFFVHGDGATDQLPLKGTDVDISIAGVIADVKVTQRYRNDGKNAIEAEYVFPGSTRAAVYALSMTIGERKVVAQIREKDQARAEYQAAKSAGKSAALLEQQRPNVFKMNVANILPGDEIVVELRYTELIVPTQFGLRVRVPHRRRSSLRLERGACRAIGGAGALAGESVSARGSRAARANFTCARRSTPEFPSRRAPHPRIGCASRTRAPSVRRSNCCAKPRTVPTAISSCVTSSPARASSPA